MATTPHKVMDRIVDALDILTRSLVVANIEVVVLQRKQVVHSGLEIYSNPFEVPRDDIVPACCVLVVRTWVSHR